MRVGAYTTPEGVDVIASPDGTLNFSIVMKADEARMLRARIDEALERGGHNT